jgi:CxxC-x17-CxxC domain-containing protein
MSFQEKTLKCADCGTDFSFTAEEQEFYQSKGYTNEPKRCPSCREARKTQRTGSRGDSYGPPRQMFSAICAQCGKETKVPFEPTNGRPVYCSDCYRKVRPGR